MPTLKLYDLGERGFYIDATVPIWVGGAGNKIEASYCVDNIRAIHKYDNFYSSKSIRVIYLAYKLKFTESLNLEKLTEALKRWNVCD